MSQLTYVPLTSTDLGDEEAFNSRFGLIVSKLNTGLDSDNFAAGSVTRAKIGQGAITAANIDQTVTWLTPTYQNGWSAHADAAFGSGARYSKTVTGYVYLRGLVTNAGGAGGTIFTLPEGYRPGIQQLFIINRNNTIGRIDVRANGEVVYVSGGATTTWHSLCNIHFRAVQ